MGAAGDWPWRSREAPGRALPHGLFDLPADQVAPALLGSVLVSTVGGIRVSGVVVETEAYTGPEDPASHARAAVGRTDRNASMFGPPGIAYVYRSYGIHWCMNVVTGEVDVPAAVLLRALEPLEGVELMEERRGRSRDLCSGPGRLCQALGVTGSLDGHPLSDPPLLVEPGWEVPDGRLGVSGRIGVSRARERPLRFYLRGHPSVSRAPRR